MLRGASRTAFLVGGALWLTLSAVALLSCSTHASPVPGSVRPHVPVARLGRNSIGMSLVRGMQGKGARIVEDTRSDAIADGEIRLTGMYANLISDAERRLRIDHFAESPGFTVVTVLIADLGALPKSGMPSVMDDEGVRHPAIGSVYVGPGLRCVRYSPQSPLMELPAEAVAESPWIRLVFAVPNGARVTRFCMDYTVIEDWSEAQTSR